MQIASLVTFATLTGIALGRLHNAALCVADRVDEGYTILTDATNCACTYYLHRYTGPNQWDQCPDCHFDGLQCRSHDWHIGGDEFDYYCEELCDAEGSEAN